MRFENTWQDIRDHSFIQNHSRPFRFTAPWRSLQFPSLSQSLFYFFILVFDRVHDAMCLNKMTSSRNIGPQHKNTAVYFIVHMGYFLSLCSPNPSWVFAAKKLLFSSDHRNQSHLKFQSCLITEYAGDCFWMSEGMSMWWCRFCLTILFWLRDSTIFCSSPAVVLGESLSTQTLLLTVY